MKIFFTKTFFPFLLLLCLTSFNLAKEQPKGVTLTKENDGYRVDFVLPEYFTNGVSAAGNIYYNLRIPEYGEPSDVGLPNLPQISFSIMIAYDEQMPVIDVLNQIKDLKILNDKIYPVQQPWPKDRRYEDRPFTIDAKYYQSTGNINGPFVKVSEPFIVAGVKGVMITVCPFAYNPSENQLMVTKSGSFRIQLKNQPSISFAPTSSFNQLYDGMFLNYTSSKSLGTGRYLIITAPAYESGLTQLVNEKTGLGYIVTVVNTTVTGTTNTAILAYIQNLYNNISTRPEFVLLVGDVDVIPDWIGIGAGTPHTDLNYSLLEGNDAFADVFIGRFPIQNTTQLSNIITKTLYMENAINGLPKKNIYCASTDNWAITEATHNFVIDSFFVSSVYTNLKLYTHTYGATTAQLISALNANQSFAIYSGHGSETSWADGPPLNQSQVNTLTNTVFPYVYSFACLTGSYYISGECFSETWVRGQNGAVVFWGSSVNSYWDEDDILEKRIFRSMFIEHLTKTSPSFVLGKYLLVQYYGSVTSTMRRYLEMYNCMGDPSIYMATYGPAIAHTPLPNTENLSGPYTVNCIITPAGQPIVNTKLFWTRGTNFNDSVTMTNTSGSNWTGNIPGNGSPASYRYYIKTIDNSGLIGTAPGGAPSNYYTFTASTDTAKPVITHTPIGNTPKTLWPVSINANVTDNIGVDSVWVRWYKRPPTSFATRHVKLNPTSGNTYSSLFNSTNAEVNFNDTIYYRIFAQDNSSGHNRDSSALYSFAIINQFNACIGTGTTSSNYPFTTYWMDGRTQMLFTAAELTAAGAGPGSAFMKIGFNVITAGGPAMNGFNVRFQHTTLSSLTNWVTSGWTTAFTGTYAVPGTGWQYIDLTSPYFAYNGTSNLLLEICYDNSSYTSYSPVYATSVSGMCRGYYTDNSSGCELTSGSNLSYRPNVCFTVTNISNSGTVSNIVPNTYSLSQNYPNPFNPVTRINFDIPKQGLVTMKVFDILGREIRALVNEVKAPGRYSVDFNGTELSSGVYFYRLESNSFTDIKRMILIK